MFTALVITYYVSFFVFIAWLVGFHYGHVQKFWHVLKNILTFASLRKPKKPVDRMVMFNGRMVAYGHVGILVKTAAQEHVLGLIPHNDEDVERACTHGDCRKARMPPDEANRAASEKLALVLKGCSASSNELRASFPKKDINGQYVGWTSDFNGITVIGNEMQIERIAVREPPPFQPDHDLIEE